MYIYIYICIYICIYTYIYMIRGSRTPLTPPFFFSARAAKTHQKSISPQEDLKHLESCTAMTFLVFCLCIATYIAEPMSPWGNILRGRPLPSKNAEIHIYTLHALLPGIGRRQ